MTSLRLVAAPQKVTRTVVDTILVTPALVRGWKSPPFQRPLRVNAKVLALAEELKHNGGVISGQLTIGILNKEKWLLDGQHRREAFLISELEEGYVDVCYKHFENMVDMGKEFVDLNSSLVSMRPDDKMRALEGTSAGLSYIRQRCPFVGYDQIRRGTASPLVSMSALLRCWYGSAPDAPVNTSPTATTIATTLTVEDATTCTDFLLLAEKAWGRDVEYSKLWTGLNMTLCMWLYRRLVITRYSPKTPTVTKEMFCKMMTSLSASSDYLDWIIGRRLSDRDRSPAYARIKRIFAARLEAETGKKQNLPQPPWLSSVSGSHP